MQKVPGTARSGGSRRSVPALPFAAGRGGGGGAQRSMRTMITLAMVFYYAFFVFREEELGV